MSSGLNLSPNITVIAIQAGIFLTNMFVVKKLMLEPYLRVRDARMKKTGGSQDDAQSLRSKALELDGQIASKMKEAHRQASEVREKIKSEAITKRNLLIAEAEKSAKEEQSKLLKDIQANLTEERTKLAATVDELSKNFVNLATMH
jgi:F0F1-type ATP synthase membrane subunit b/b'